MSAERIDVLAVTMQTRWTDAKGREWRIVEKLPFGRNICTTTDGRYQGEWTHKEIRASLTGRRLVSEERAALARALGEGA